MLFVESVEARRLFAVTPDVTFGNGGHISFSSDYAVLNVLATHGEIYVHAYQRARDRNIIFKYTDAGVLDTSWGRNGYILPRLFDDADSNLRLNAFTLVRDSRTGGLLVGGFDNGAAVVVVDRFVAGGTLDPAWGTAGRVAYSEAKTTLTLPRVITLPHKQIFLALGRTRHLGRIDPSYSRARDDENDVALLKFDANGRYDRTFNGGHAVTVASGMNHTTTSFVVESADETVVQDATIPTFGDVQFFSDNRFRMVSTREETHQTTTIHNSEVFTTVGRTVVSAESAIVTPDGSVLSKRTQSYVLERLTIDDNVTRIEPTFTPMAVVASADGTGIAVLAETNPGGVLVRVGPNYRSSPERLPAPLGRRYLGNVRLTGDGTVLAQSSGTGSSSDDPENNPIGFGPGIVSLGRDLAVGDHRVILPPTYFPEFAFSVYTTDDQGRLLIEGLNHKQYDLIRYV